MERDHATDSGAVATEILSRVRGAEDERIATLASSIDLFSTVRQGAINMIAEGATSDADIQRASEALSLLINEMNEVRLDRGFSELREETLSRALGRLCPGFWPFC